MKVNGNTPWGVANNGTGKRCWFVCRTRVNRMPHETELEYHVNKRGDLIRFTLHGAEVKAAELNNREGG